jgi:ubiquinone/menaquinone biosynthesis C-methylase UbiE
MTLPTSNLIIQVSLTTKLPFDDDEFDHVHVHAIARAVPENKVNLFEIGFDHR